MTIIEGMRTFLLANTSIAAIAGTRVFPLRLPQKLDLSNGKGAIVLTRIDEIGEAHLRGPNALVKARIQVDAYAVTHDDATALGTLCSQRLDGYQGTWTDGASPASLIRVQAILEEQEGDRFEEELQGGFCRHMAEYVVCYVAVGEPVLI